MSGGGEITGGTIAMGVTKSLATIKEGTKSSATIKDGTKSSTSIRKNTNVDNFLSLGANMKFNMKDGYYCNVGNIDQIHL